ncbi:hypothetical protein ACWEV3_40845 [Saccharopolyspora sp. NPDC003752]
MSTDFDAETYNDVATRIREFRAQYPAGSLRPADPAVPYRIEQLGEQIYIVVVAAAYRSPHDQLPGIGMAYEPFPGRDDYTKDAELQNAETSAWGRAIVAALAADTRRGIASAEEINGRGSARQLELRRTVWAKAEERGWIHGDDYRSLAENFTAWSKGGDFTSADESTLRDYLKHLEPKRTMRRSNGGNQ